MTFELDSLTKVRVLDVRVLARKDRKPDEPPGAQLLLRATLPVGALSMFDGFLAGWLYRKATTTKQGALDGMEESELTSAGQHVKRLPWDYEQTGCDVEIDYGSGGKSNIGLADCKVHRLSMRPEQKGVVVQWTIDAPGLSTAMRGKLTDLKATDVQMTMTAPEPADDAQGDIETDPDTPPGQEPRKPGAAERAAVAKAGGDAGPVVAHKGDAHPDDRDAWPFPGDGKPKPVRQAKTAADKNLNDPAWPFPTGNKAGSEKPPQPVTVETSRPGTRTARGRDRTKAALAAGAKANGTVQ